MGMYVQKPRADMAQAWQWPEGGPTQHEVAKEIAKAGLELGLYDGCVEHGEYNDGSKWQWRWATLKNGDYKSAKVGDWIVIDGEMSFVMSDDGFKAKYRGFQ